MTEQTHHDLTGRAALVTGATRGAGRAIAWELGRADAVVYCTGRSTAGHPSDHGRDETIEETAGLIRDEGGVAHAVVDHLDAGFRTHLPTSHAALGLLIRHPGGVPSYAFVISETPAMLARGITALAADPARH